MIGLTNLPGSWEHFYNDFVTDGVKYMFRVSTVSLLKVDISVLIVESNSDFVDETSREVSLDKSDISVLSVENVNEDKSQGNLLLRRKSFFLRYLDVLLLSFTLRYVCCLMMLQ